MRDHTFATARTDWDATARNWLRKAEADAVTKLQAATGRRAAATAEPEWRRLERERNEAALGPYAAKRKPPTNTIDMEPQHGTASLLD